MDKWRASRDKKTIEGVNHGETTTTPQGGKQSRLDYRFDLIDAKAMFDLARVMHEGAKKYEKDNWRKISTDDHLNHALSHIWAHLAGDKQDNHLGHALTRVMMALAVNLQDKPDDKNCRICSYCVMGIEARTKLGLDPCLSCDDASSWRPVEDDEWTLRG